MTAKLETPYRLSGALILLELARQIVLKTDMGEQARHGLIQGFTTQGQFISLMAESDVPPTRQQQAEVDNMVGACLDFLNSHEARLSADDLETLAVARSRYTGARHLEDALVF